MKYVILILFILSQHALAEEINPDLPLLLNEMSAICGDRWSISVGDDDTVYLNSKEMVLGEANGYGFPPGEQLYTLHFRFKWVVGVSNPQAIQLRQQLEDLRKQAEAIKHTKTKGYYSYEPHGLDQWALVLKTKKAEEKVEDIPEYQFKSVHLSEDYSMKFFVPNERDKKSLQYKSDIDRLYQLLKKPSPNHTDTGNGSRTPTRP